MIVCLREITASKETAFFPFLVLFGFFCFLFFVFFLLFPFSLIDTYASGRGVKYVKDNEPKNEKLD